MNIGFDTQSTSEHLLCAIIEKLAMSGNSVHVIQMIHNNSFPAIPQKLKDLGVTSDSVYHKAPKKTNFIARYISAIKYYCKCKHILKAYKESDAVFIQSTNTAGVAIWFAKRYLKHAKITFNVQDIFPYNLMYCGRIKQNGLLFKFLAKEQRYAYTHADHVITISEDMKDTLVNDGVNKDKISVIYNWSYQDEPYTDVDTSAVSHMFKAEYFNVVYAGNIGLMQNVDILIEAAKLMKEDKSVWFHIIGNGVYKDKLEAKARDYDIKNISFWPMQKPELAPVIYSAADVNVIPLAKNIYRTALPSKTATCLACQKPVIFAVGIDSKFMQKVKEDAGCHVVESDDPEGLVLAIRKVQEGQENNKIAEFFIDHFRATENSKKYSEIIIR